MPPAPRRRPRPRRQHAPRERLPRAARRSFLLIVALAAVTLGLRTWLASRHLVVTSDNAQVDGHITPIAPKVQAFVSRVLVDDNQDVKVG